MEIYEIILSIILFVFLASSLYLRLRHPEKYAQTLPEKCKDCINREKCQHKG